jgi:sugar lactone lactonase YvrE
MKVLSFFISIFCMVCISNAQTVTTYAGVFGGLFCDGTTFGATFSNPTGLCLDAAGNVFIADTNNNRIRKMTPAGVVTTFAGSVSGFADGTTATAKFNQPTGIIFDGAGNLYVTDAGNHKIRKITSAGVVSTLAGSTQGYADGLGSAAKFSWPYGLCLDATGNLYVADRTNHKIRKVTAAGIVSTVAGSSLGYADGSGTGAKFYNPRSIAMNSNGDFFIADSDNFRIRKMTAAGVVTTFAGSGILGTADGTGTAAQFLSPYGICADAAGNLFVADNSSDGLVRKITPAAVVSSLAGGTAGFDYGIGTNSNFASPAGICVDPTGNVYVSGQLVNTIKKITPANTVINMAGAYINSYSDGTGTPIQSDALRVCADPAGNVYALERSYNRIRKITPAGIVTTFAGSGVIGSTNGTGIAARFNGPEDICYDAASGNIYVADTFNNSIRKVTPSGVVTTFATGFSGPKGVCTDALGNVYVSDTWNFRIKKITPAGVVSTVAIYGSNSGFAITGICMDAAGNFYLAYPEKYVILKVTPPGSVTVFAGQNMVSGDLDGIGAAAQLTYPYSITMGNDGNLYTVDGFKIKRISLAGVVTTLVGSTSGDVDGTGAMVKFKPSGLCFTTTDDMIYIADNGNQKVKKMTGFMLDIPSNSMLDTGIKLYPNPAHNSVTIEVNASLVNAEVCISDLTGKRLRTYNLSEIHKTLDVSDYEKGIYFVTVTAESKSSTLKFIKE